MLNIFYHSLGLFSFLAGQRERGKKDEMEEEEKKRKPGQIFCDKFDFKEEGSGGGSLI